jgi:hypothetical protein
MHTRWAASPETSVWPPRRCRSGPRAAVYTCRLTRPFVTGTDGKVSSTYWDSATDWAGGWFAIGDGVAAVGSPVTVVARNPDHMDLFVTGTDGKIYSIAGVSVAKVRKSLPGPPRIVESPRRGGLFRKGAARPTACSREAKRGIRSPNLGGRPHCRCGESEPEVTVKPSSTRYCVPAVGLLLAISSASCAETCRPHGDRLQGDESGWRFRAPEGLHSTWCTPRLSTPRVALFVVVALLVTVVATTVGIVLLPVELLVFFLVAIATKNFFWLTMIVTWKYVLLFYLVFS